MQTQVSVRLDDDLSERSGVIEDRLARFLTVAPEGARIVTRRGSAAVMRIHLAFTHDEQGWGTPHVTLETLEGRIALDTVEFPGEKIVRIVKDITAEVNR